MLSKECCSIGNQLRCSKLLDRIDHAHDGIGREFGVGLIPVVFYELPRRSPVSTVSHGQTKQEWCVLCLHFPAESELAGTQEEIFVVELGKCIQLTQLLLRSRRGEESVLQSFEVLHTAVRSNHRCRCCDQLWVDMVRRLFQQVSTQTDHQSVVAERASGFHEQPSQLGSEVALISLRLTEFVEGRLD